MRSVFFQLTIFLLLPHVLLAQKAKPDLDYTEVDARSAKVQNKDISSGIVTLSEYLTSPYDNDFKKVRALTIWMINNINYDVAGFLSFRKEKQSAPKTLKVGMGLMPDICGLFNSLCRHANIPSVTVEGYMKDFLYEEGDTFYMTNHHWNMVQIDSSWYVIDLLKAANYINYRMVDPSQLYQKGKLTGPFHESTFKREKKDISERYFLADLKEFAQSHIAAAPMWQLSIDPLPMSKFTGSLEDLMAHLDRPKEDTLLHFERYINKYIKAEASNQKFLEARHAKNYYPNNHHLTAYNYTEFANSMSQKDHAYASAYKEAVTLYDEALVAAELYKGDNKNNYQYQKEKLKVRNKVIVARSEVATKYYAKLKKKFAKEKKTLKEKIKAQKKSQTNYLKKQAPQLVNDLGSVNRPKKTTEKKQKIIEECEQLITKNQQRIALLVDSTSILSEQIGKAYLEVGSNRSSARAVYNTIQPLITTTTLLNLYDRKLSRILFYNGKKDSLFEVRDKHMAKASELLKEIKYMHKDRNKRADEALALLKDNKKLIKKIKKSSAKDKGEQALFKETLGLMQRMYDAKAARYKEEARDNEALVDHLKLEKKVVLTKQLKFLKKEKKVEMARYKRLNKFYQNYFEKEKADIGELIKEIKRNQSATVRKVEGL